MPARMNADETAKKRRLLMPVLPGLRDTSPGAVQPNLRIVVGAWQIRNESGPNLLFFAFPELLVGVGIGGRGLDDVEAEIGRLVAAVAGRGQRVVRRPESS